MTLSANTKMKITLTCFRSHLDASFEIPDNQLTLLSGDSGVGKSTLFEAILWCLYGGMSKIRPFDEKKKATLVELDFGSMIIRRSRPPEVVEVRLITDGESRVLPPDQSTAFIRSRFGSRELWICSSYLLQQSRSALLDFTANEKFQLLHELCFGLNAGQMEDPDYYLSRVERKILEAKSWLQAEVSKYNISSEVWRRKMEDHAAALHRWSSRSREMSPLREEISGLRAKIPQLEAQLLQSRDQESRRESCLTQIKRWEEELETIPDVDEARLEVERAVLQQHQQLQEQLTREERLLASFRHQPGEGDPTTLDAVEKRRREIVEAKGPHLLLARLGLRIEQIPDLLSRLTRLRECREHHRRYQQYQDYQQKRQHWLRIQEEIKRQEGRRLQYQSQIKTLEAEVAQLPESFDLKKSHAELVSIRERRLHVTLLLRELICPHCGSGLNFDGKELSAGHTSKDQRVELLEEQKTLDEREKLLLEEQHQHEKRRQLVQKIRELTRQHDAIIIPQSTDSPTPIPEVPPPSEPCPRDVEIRQLEDCLHSAELITKDIASRAENLFSLESEYQRLEAVEKYQRQLGIIARIRESQRQLPSAPDLEDHRRRVTRHERRRLLLSNLREMIVPEAPTPSSAESQLELKQCQEKLGELEDDLRAGELWKSLDEQRSAIEEQHQQIDRITVHEQRLLRLKEIIQQTSADALDEVVDAINTTINQILPRLFTSSIEAHLRTHRELKNGRTRVQVNLQISYRGHIYDHINQLSVGEQNRISIAILLAVAKLNSSPLLLIDETLSSLPSAMKERCLATIREYLSHKTVIHVCHEALEGHHDHIVRLG